MKTFLSVLFCALLTAQTAGAARILSGEVDYQQRIVTLKLMSGEHCNSRSYQVRYTMSNRATFGPHHYSLEERALTRMACSGEAEVTLQLTFDEIFRGQLQDGLHYLHGAQRSSYGFWTPEHAAR